MNPLRLLVANLLAFGLSLVLFFWRKRLIQIDLGEFVDQIRQHERIRIVRVEKRPALLREIGFVRLLIDGEKKLFLKREEFLLSRVSIKGQLRFIDCAPLIRIFHHPQQLFVAWLAQFHFEHEAAASFDVALLKFLRGFTGYAITQHRLLAYQLLDQRLPFVVLMG